MAGQNVSKATTHMPIRNKMKMPAKRPAADASRCTSSWCSSSSMSDQDKNKHYHNKHEHDEDGSDSLVICFVRSDVVFHES